MFRLGYWVIIMQGKKKSSCCFVIVFCSYIVYFNFYECYVIVWNVLQRKTFWIVIHIELIEYELSVKCPILNVLTHSSCTWVMTRPHKVSHNFRFRWVKAYITQIFPFHPTFVQLHWTNQLFAVWFWIESQNFTIKRGAMSYSSNVSGIQFFCNLSAFLVFLLGANCYYSCFKTLLIVGCTNTMLTKCTALLFVFCFPGSLC